MIFDYYSKKLSGKRLDRVYTIAPDRVRQYLHAEIDFVRSHLGPEDSVLELGCGTGRVALALADSIKKIVGIDTAKESLKLAGERSSRLDACEWFEMDALSMDFPDCSFDAVLCLQNGICAFGVDKEKLVLEALRVAVRNGKVFFSSYSDAFWTRRLEWFRIQAAEGLLGEIDEEATGNGVIVCRDGFRAARMEKEDFRSLCAKLGLNARIEEVDRSSVFCVIRKQ